MCSSWSLCGRPLRCSADDIFQKTQKRMIVCSLVPCLLTTSEVARMHGGAKISCVSNFDASRTKSPRRRASKHGALKTESYLMSPNMTKSFTFTDTVQTPTISRPRKTSNKNIEPKQKEDCRSSRGRPLLSYHTVRQHFHHHHGTHILALRMR